MLRLRGLMLIGAFAVLMAPISALFYTLTGQLDEVDAGGFIFGTIGCALAPLLVRDWIKAARGEESVWLHWWD